MQFKGEKLNCLPNAKERAKSHKEAPVLRKYTAVTAKAIYKLGNQYMQQGAPHS
jgi:hypothetical protein